MFQGLDPTKAEVVETVSFKRGETPDFDVYGFVDDYVDNYVTLADGDSIAVVDMPELYKPDSSVTYLVICGTFSVPRHSFSFVSNGGGVLDPSGDATRAELAAMLHRLG